jgi:hypothetical protein
MNHKAFEVLKRGEWISPVGSMDQKPHHITKLFRMDICFILGQQSRPPMAHVVYLRMRAGYSY